MSHFYHPLLQEGDMPIEELLALYNCVPPPLPSTSLPSQSKRSSRRARSGSAIQPENTPRVPDVVPPTTAIESASCSEPDAPSENTLASPDSKDTIVDKSNIDKAIRTGEKIETDQLDALPIETNADEMETDMKIESDKAEVVAKAESKPTDSVELNRDSEFTEMDEGDDDDDEEDESDLRKLYPETFKTNEPRLLRGKSECAGAPSITC